MRCEKLVGALLLAVSLLLPGSQAMAAVWTDHYNASNGYSFAGEGISTITFDDWGYTGPGGRNAKDFAPINGFGTLGQQQHVLTLWPDRLTPDSPYNILHDITNSPAYTNANMDAQVNFYYWGYTSPGFDVPTDFTAYRAADYSASIRQGSLFNNMLIDLDGDYFVSKNDMHFNYYKVFSYVDATGVNASQDVSTTLSFQPYPVSDAIGWCGSALASHPAALEVMAGQLTFDFAFDVYNGPNRVFMGTQVVPGFEMRSYGTLTVNVWAGSDLQTFASNAVVNNTNPNNADRWDVDPNYYSHVSFHGGGVLPDGAWISADSFNPDGSRKLNPDGTWNVTVVPAGTAGAIWHGNAFAGYAFILRADGYRSLDWFDEAVYGPDPCTNKNCDDGNVCTTDSCVGGVCLNKPMSCPTGQACNPATGACAPFDFCANVVCNDNNLCTVDTCNSATGCVYTPVVCNDNNACTADSCNPATGACVFTLISCDDGNACTTDTCNSATGCVHTPAVVCNDNNLCTTDSCDPATGACVFTPVNCDDGNTCTTDSCNPATGACVHALTNACNTVDTTNNNFTMNQPDGTAFGGANDVHFTWDGTRKTSVVVSGQIANATLASSCPFFGYTWSAHDVAVYGPGTYTVYAGCPAGSPGCGAGIPITFTVPDGQLGGHMLFNWGVNKDIDVVDMWTPKAAFAPSPMWTGKCGSNPADKIWDWMSYDWDGDGVNGYAMVDGPFSGMNANFNIMGIPVVVDTTNNNFTMNQPDGTAFGGANDVHFTWDGTRKTSVVVSGQIANATLASSCPFFGYTWSAHDVAVYGPGTYTVYAGCPAGSPGCGAGIPITFTVPDGQLGGHMLFNWGVNKDIDVVDMWTPKAAFAPSPMWTGKCGSNPADKIWDLMSYDWDGDGVNGYAMVDGPFSGMNANFNVMGTVDRCKGVVCNDNNACTTDSCDPATGNCVFTPISCDDNNACTTDTCDPATGACVHTAISCGDNNACTSDSCDPATGCVFTPVACPTGQTCDPATGNCVVVNLCAGKVCNDNNACTTDTCNPATGNCVFTSMSCNDNNACTTDTCDPATGLCVYTADNSLCPPTSGNNFTMLDPGNNQAGGTNDVVFAWDGTMKTSVAVSGQVSNALLTSTCPFFGVTWAAHDVTVYGPGTYTVYSGCPAGSPGCGTGAPINFTVGAGQIGVHMLFNWNGNNDIDVVNVMKANAVSSNMWTGGCGSNAACTVWGWESYDFDGDGVNGTGMVDGPFAGMNANFNLNKVSVDPCCSCVPINSCDTPSCDPVNGCQHHVISCNDNNACTTDTCNSATGCVYTAISCNDNNACTTDSCNPSTGCVYTPVACPTGQTCDPATGNCVTVDLCAGKVCNDNNACTTDACDPATGKCVYTANNSLCPPTSDNNFTMIDPMNNQAGGTNDVVFAWDGTMKTSVAVSGQVSNALLTSSCPFFGVTWAAHDVTVYGPGAYTIFSGCPAGSPGCGTGAPINFTVGASQIGIHMLFNWNGNNDIDVVNVMNPNVVSSNMWTGGCGSNSACTVWKWSSSDPDHDGVNGMPMVDGPFLGMNANFNLIKVSVDPCCNVVCDACSICDPITGACAPSLVLCDDNNACTTDTCDAATGCVHTAISCDDGNACTTDSCDKVLGCQHAAIGCDDNNACTTDTCDPAKGCQHTPISCDDNNACTADSCDPGLGCQHPLITCNPIDACHTASCDAIKGCQQTAKANCCLSNTDCNDNNACTADSCVNNACVYTPIIGGCNTNAECSDGNICTTDTCVQSPNTCGICSHTWIPGCCLTAADCDDSNVCTADSCVNNACVHTPAVCNDNNACTTDSCDPATGCVFTPVVCPSGETCNPTDGTCASACPAGSVMSITVLGGGQNPNSVDKQIMTSFTVVNNSGCIVAWTKNSVTATKGTILQYDCKRGIGPQPSKGTWDGTPIAIDSVNQITLPATSGTVGKLILDNQANGGKDTDRITVSAQ